MAYTHHERLSALDASFLGLEESNVHMHIGAVSIYESGPLATPEGGIDFARIRAATLATLHHTPRFRQRLALSPVFGHPTWVDDPTFNLDYHLRHTSLALPGDVRRLKRLAGRIMSQKLDRGKPLWELWFIEGVEGNCFATITKVHHCMVDGIGGRDLLTGLMRKDPLPPADESRTWLPRPAPSEATLFAEELSRRASVPFSMARAGMHAVTHPVETLRALGEVAETIGDTATAAMSPASETPLNQEIGPYRRFDWTRHDLDGVKEIKNALGGTLNDVVLAIVAGALRRFLTRRGVPVRELDFRVAVPVNVRTAAQRTELGNRTSSIVVPLPLDEPDPRKRLLAVTRSTSELKHSRQSQGVEAIGEISDWTFPRLFTFMARMATRTRAANMTVTNVPGPRRPSYLLGARMLAVYPLVPLFANQCLGVSLFSYDGGLFWGFNSDWDSMEDLHDFAEAINGEFEELSKAAAEGPRVR